jgi:hypothetical protein
VQVMRIMDRVNSFCTRTLGQLANPTVRGSVT